MVRPGNFSGSKFLLAHRGSTATNSTVDGDRQICEQCQVAGHQHQLAPVESSSANAYTGLALRRAQQAGEADLQAQGIATGSLVRATRMRGVVPALIAALAWRGCSRARPQLPGPTDVHRSAAVRPTGGSVLGPPRDLTLTCRTPRAPVRHRGLRSSDRRRNNGTNPCAQRCRLIRQCPIRKIQKIRHIHTTVGAVVTFQRGSCCLRRSCA